eukprot:2479251-Rhodomonas_salina.2
MRCTPSPSPSLPAQCATSVPHSPHPPAAPYGACYRAYSAPAHAADHPAPPIPHLSTAHAIPDP